MDSLTADLGHSRGIAIVGMACRVPGVDTASGYWQAVLSGVDTFQPVSDEQLLARGVRQRDLDDPGYVRATRSLPGIEHFDAAFFGIPPREARYMDPQQRVFLECCHEALEAAGYPPGEQPMAVGVFAGSAASTYMLHHILATSGDQDPNEVLYEYSRSNDKDYLTTVVSYRLNLTGPSMSINTACSSALVSVVQACKSLLDHECDMALAGGIRIELPAGLGYKHRKGGILSPDGRCFAFDASAMGTVFADGAGLVALKRLDEALADGDHIHAVIEGFATNNDGARKAGYSAPGPEGQEAVLREALAFAGVAPQSVGYVEAHGTGTVVGDPIEFQSLSRVFPPAADGRPYCGLGSVKANFGHLNTAAGAAGLIKAAQVVEHGVVPPQVNFRTPNPEIRLDGSAFYITTEAKPWPAGSQPRRAGVSAFGVGGSNVHLVLRQAPAREPAAGQVGAPRLLVLSAKSEAALAAQALRLRVHLESQPGLPLRDVAYTLQRRRRHHPHRLSLVCDSVEGALQQLAGVPPGKGAAAAAPRVVFMFPGQGSQYAGMGRGLYHSEPVFAQAVDRCLQAVAGQPEAAAIREALLGTSAPAEAALTGTGITQPALFVVEYALAQLYMHWGLQPQALIGHSLGEFVAACLSGVMTLPDALSLVVARGRVMQAMPEGAMCSVALDAESVREHLPVGCEVAAANGPFNTVVAGSPAALAQAEAAFERHGLTFKRLNTSHAFHCALVDEALPAFRAALSRVRLSTPHLPYVSNVTGGWITAEDATSVEHWVRHMRQPVRFAEGIAAVLDGVAEGLLVEVGPGTALGQLARQQPRRGLRVVDSLRRSVADERAHLLVALGRCWEAGATVRWEALPDAQGGRTLPLPTYAFQRTRHWVDVEPRVAAPAKAARRADIADWFYVPGWKLDTRPAAVAAVPLRQLVVVDDFSVPLAEVLRAQGHDLRCVRAGSSFVQDAAGFQLDLCSPEQVARLVDALRKAHWKPHQLVLATHLAPAASQAQVPGDVEHAVTAMLHLAQAIKADDLAPGARCRVLTGPVFRVTGVEPVDPRGAAAVGACRAMADELHYLAVQAIDLEPAAEVAGDWAAVLDELQRPVGHRVVALRHGRRWAEQFDARRIDAAPGVPVLREGGCYVVTGGYGGVGRIVCKWLACTPGVKIAVLGRVEVPPPAAWQALAKAPDTPARLRDAVALLLQLQALGAHVLPLAVDVSRPADVEHAMAEVRRELGPVDGLFHLAGSPSDDTIARKTAVGVARTLAPKVQGTLALATALRAHPARFVVLFSSLSAVTGGIKQFEYSAANAFLDAVAHRMAGEGGTRWLSINWDAWQAGMAANTVVPAHLEHLKAQALENAVSAAEGMEVLQRLLAAEAEVQVVVSTRDIAARSVAGNAALAQRPQSQAEPETTDVAQAGAGTVAAGEVEQHLAAIWRVLLGHEAIAPTDNFFSLGGDSLLATKVVARINAELAVDIGVRDFLEMRDLAELAALVRALQSVPSGDDPQAIQEQTW